MGCPAGCPRCLAPHGIPMGYPMGHWIAMGYPMRFPLMGYPLGACSRHGAPYGAIGADADIPPHAQGNAHVGHFLGYPVERHCGLGAHELGLNEASGLTAGHPTTTQTGGHASNNAIQCAGLAYAGARPATTQGALHKGLVRHRPASHAAPHMRPLAPNRPPKSPNLGPLAPITHNQRQNNVLTNVLNQRFQEGHPFWGKTPWGHQ